MILEGVGAEILNPPFQVWNEYSHAPTLTEHSNSILQFVQDTTRIALPAH